MMKVTLLTESSPIRLTVLSNVTNSSNSRKSSKRLELKKKESNLNFIHMLYRLQLDAYNYLNGRHHKLEQ